VYLDPIPSQNELSPITMIDVSKPENVHLADLIDMSVVEQRQIRVILDRLLPMQVRSAAGDYQIRVESVLSHIENVNKSTIDTVAQKLTSLNLPYCLDEAPAGIPDSLWEKICEVQSKGGSGAIANNIEFLEQLDKMVGQLIDECTVLMENERQDDQLCRAQYGSRWNRKHSGELTANFTSNLESYKKKLGE